MSLAQRWARKRNGNKMRLKGLEANLSQMLSMHRSIFVSYELRYLAQAQRRLEMILDNWEFWNEASKNNYLLKEKEEK